ncbi:MAG: 4'-phosphopantetheinyl transferase AcpT [Mixta sp.]
MQQVMLGKVSLLHKTSLPPALRQQAPTGPRRAPWLAGRVLLSRLFFPASLPEIVYGVHGKPAFREEIPLWFNLSHSGDNIALIVSDEGEVGCDIEEIRPRKNWRRLADSVFSAGEMQEIDAEPEENQLHAFWRIWTCKEAILKRFGNTVWQMAETDSTAVTHCFISHLQIEDSLSMALCTSVPHTFSVNDIIWQHGAPTSVEQN